MRNSPCFRARPLARAAADVLVFVVRATDLENEQGSAAFFGPQGRELARSSDMNNMRAYLKRYFAALAFLARPGLAAVWAAEPVTLLK